MDYQIKQIEGFPNYSIDTDGNVWSFGSGKGWKAGGPYKKALYKERDGRLTLTLSKDKKDYSKRVHRLVAEAFIPNPENKPQVNHRDGNASNNAISNLYWGTQTENHVDITIHGTRSQGEKRWNAKLTQWQVIRMRLLAEFKPHLTHNAIAKIYGVSRVAVTDILSRRNWKHI